MVGWLLGVELLLVCFRVLGCCVVRTKGSGSPRRGA